VEGQRRLESEVGKARASVEAFAPNLPEGAKDALTSLTYNAGPGWQNSGLGKAILAGDNQTAQQLFGQYINAGGQPNEGLQNRRQTELSWWNGGGQAVPIPANQPATYAGMSQPALTPGSPAPPLGSPIAIDAPSLAQTAENAPGTSPVAPAAGLMGSNPQQQQQGWGGGLAGLLSPSSQNGLLGQDAAPPAPQFAAAYSPKVDMSKLVSFLQARQSAPNPWSV
jgi:hypothetical protein